MKQKPQERDWSFFKLLLGRSLLPMLVTLVLLITFGLLFLHQSRQSYQQALYRFQTQKLQELVAIMEDDLLSVNMIQRRVANGTELEELVFCYDDITYFRRYFLQLAMKDQLFIMVDDSKYVKDAFLYILPLERLITSTMVTKDIPEWLLTLEKEGKQSLIYWEDELFLIYRKLDYQDEISEVAFFVLQLNEEALLDSLSYVHQTPNDFSFVCWDNQPPEACGLHDLEAATLAMNQPGETKEQYTSISVPGTQYTFTAHYFMAGEALGGIFQSVSTFVFVFLAVVLLWLLASTLNWYFMMYKPLRVLLVDAFHRVEQGDLKYRIPLEAGPPMAKLYASFNRMVAQMDYEVENNLKQKLLVSRANLKQLQSQISPHFIYNSYYVLYRLIQDGDMEKSAVLCENLGQFFQYITRSNEDEKRLYEEVEHARTFANIQQFRFGKKLAVQVETPPPAIRDRYVPRLILQPVLENAFKYAYDMSPVQEQMRLHIGYELEQEDIFAIVVENSGAIEEEVLEELRQKLRDTQSPMETTALINIHRRLQIYFGEESGIKLERSEMGGLLVRMRIKGGDNHGGESLPHAGGG